MAAVAPVPEEGEPVQPLTERNLRRLNDHHEALEKSGVPAAEVFRLSKQQTYLQRDKIGHPREDKGPVFVVFLLTFWFAILINYDSGAIPAVLSQVQEEFDFTEFELGFVGALPFIGTAVASIPSGRALQIKNGQMHVLFWTTVLNTATVAGMALAPEMWSFYVNRFVNGAAQTAFVIWANVWVDEFAPPQRLALWMGLVQAGTIVGVMVGYLVAGMLNLNGVDWRWSIWILVFAMAPYCIILAVCCKWQRYVNIPDPEALQKAMDDFADKRRDSIEFGGSAGCAAAMEHHAEGEGLGTPGSGGALLREAREFEREGSLPLAVSKGASAKEGDDGDSRRSNQSRSFVQTQMLTALEGGEEKKEKEEDRVSIASGVSMRSQALLVATPAGAMMKGLALDMIEVPDPEGDGRRLSGLHPRRSLSGVGRRPSQSAASRPASPTATLKTHTADGANTLKALPSAPSHAGAEASPDDLEEGGEGEAAGGPPVRRRSLGKNLAAVGGVDRIPEAAELEEVGLVIGGQNERGEAGMGIERGGMGGYVRVATSDSMQIAERDWGGSAEAGAGLPAPADRSDVGSSVSSGDRWSVEPVNNQVWMTMLTERRRGNRGNNSDWGEGEEGVDMMSVGEAGSKRNKGYARAPGSYQDEQVEAAEKREAAEALVDAGGKGLKEDGWRKGVADLMVLCFNPIYMSMVMGLCALYFVVTGIQFWSTFFFLETFSISTEFVVMGFSVTAVTAPIIGVVGGGLIVDALGGYKNEQGMIRSQLCCSLFAALSTSMGFLSALALSFWTSLAFLWLVLAFGGAILPPALGLLLNTVDLELRPLASGFSIFMYTLLGYALGNVVPGAVMSAIQEGGILWGFRMILLWPVIGLVFFFLAAIFQLTQYRRKNGVWPPICDCLRKAKKEPKSLEDELNEKAIEAQSLSPEAAAFNGTSSCAGPLPESAQQPRLTHSSHGESARGQNGFGAFDAEQLGEVVMQSPTIFDIIEMKRNRKSTSAVPAKNHTAAPGAADMAGEGFSDADFSPIGGRRGDSAKMPSKSFSKVGGESVGAREGGESPGEKGRLPQKSAESLSTPVAVEDVF
uniref:Major facilitator superfamily (MFS) profile domain-containing protein n=1 Tax=Chromera velia CCMP2878 TaxID=1169474 RepID=A0A0G4G5U4_9ALVE|eukprot:Cvel_20278.t1-p1 / transcript=Cvel_20278.t1 / gene=Cvel_20278 / organism=Chromera_velia_CCMP2878 / gene_product=Probable sphingolipid transporter spinster homolog, putative / transcript_product=Probable sphingolipid transporter spinster homolog, putative / location=Cvel_scaffold1809:25566-33130(-) / protein_length=1079 / sequence_SO=supercontig / SO=protein_coding / is_pseudo=false